ncbi:MAG: ferrochelatase [Actinobacteria bacterium]|nr:ferrochelatase [Actinomycetota bacterium]MCL5445107.1 ferrochelatase [Actinomycetota bacterium]
MNEVRRSRVGDDGGRVGVLVMAHGTPGTREEIEPFYTRIRRGNPPSREQLDDLVRRYDAIGGVSPLAALTRSQVDGLTKLLSTHEPGRYLVRYGAKHTAPFIEDAALDLVKSGVDETIGLVLTPHYSSAGAGEYLDRAARAISNSGTSVTFLPIKEWYENPAFVDVVAGLVTDRIDELRGRGEDHVTTVFSAHSIPMKVAESGDPYADQVFESASLVAEAANLANWRVAWQSAGRTAFPWLSPDLLTTLRSVAEQGSRACVVCPIGFVSDHLEILYDVDIEAANTARELGLELCRTESLNDDPRFLRVLADVVRSTAARP